MTTVQGQRLLDALLDSWDRNNTILLNLLRAIPAGTLDARAMEGSPTVAEMLTHMHHERMVSVLENCPEYAGQVPAHEWIREGDATVIAQMLHESGTRVRDAVKGRVQADQPMDLDFSHPIQLVQLLIFH